MLWDYLESRGFGKEEETFEVSLLRKRRKIVDLHHSRKGEEKDRQCNIERRWVAVPDL